jgi:phosphoribosylanthranilate isomerase
VVKVKIEGIQNIRDAEMALDAGADILGFVFYPPSPRAVDIPAARDIACSLPPFISTIGVFVDEPLEYVKKVRDDVGLHAVQLHGNEPPDMVRALGPRAVKAFRVGPEFSPAAIARYGVSTFLLDAYRKGTPGGTGETFDWDVAVECRSLGRLILAGGLNPENVAAAVTKVRPYAVDVASGVESGPGKKDPARVRDFIQAAKEAALRSASPPDQGGAGGGRP